MTTQAMATGRTWIFDHTRLRELREGRGLAVDAAAAVIEVHPDTWRKWEAGSFQPPAGKLARICSLFQVAPGFFFIARTPESA